MPTSQAPMCLALVLADAIWQDPSSGKRTILGTFSTLCAKTFPAVHPVLAVYCALTDGYGKTPLKLLVVDCDEEKTLIEASGEVNFIDPRMVVEIDFHLPNIVFPKPGEYRFQIYGADEFLMERRLVAVDQNSGRLDHDE